MNKVHFSSNSPEWETPQLLFEEYNYIYNFTLDAAASKENAKCEYFLSKDTDALEADWNIAGGNVWLNPPYGRIISKFIFKAYRESLQGIKVVCLLPARTDTMWFHDYCLKYGKITFLRGRLHFSNNKSPAPFPSMIVVFG